MVSYYLPNIPISFDCHVPINVFCLTELNKKKATLSRSYLGRFIAESSGGVFFFLTCRPPGGGPSLGRLAPDGVGYPQDVLELFFRQILRKSVKGKGFTIHFGFTPIYSRICFKVDAFYCVPKVIRHQIPPSGRIICFGSLFAKHRGLSQIQDVCFLFFRTEFLLGVGHRRWLFKATYLKTFRNAYLGKFWWPFTTGREFPTWLFRKGNNVKSKKWYFGCKDMQQKCVWSKVDHVGMPHATWFINLMAREQMVEMGIACMAALVKHGHSVSATKTVVGTMEYLQRWVETDVSRFEVVISRPLGFLVSTFLTGNWYNQEHLYCHDYIAASLEISIGVGFVGNGCSKSYQICLWSTGQTNAVHRGWNLLCIHLNRNELVDWLHWAKAPQPFAEEAVMPAVDIGLGEAATIVG